MDLMVFPEYRNKGIASKLMDVAEKEATRFNNKIYLEVCPNKEYGPAQRMYAKRGYIPDGKGVYIMNQRFVQQTQNVKMMMN